MSMKKHIDGLVQYMSGFTKEKSNFPHSIGLRRAGNYLIRYWILYAMLLLPIAFFIIFRYVPMFNILLAFKENNIFLPLLEVPWAGIANFARAWAMDHFHNAVKSTIMFSILDLIVGFPAPIILALLLNELKFRRFKRITQTISYMPFFLSWIIISGMALRLFATNTGAVNNILMAWFNMQPIPFLGETTHWVWTVVLIAVWRSLGWNTIIYLAAITSISPELYEAAEVDGASRLRKIWHVTLPGIRPVIVILFILTMGNMMGADFERFMSLSNHLVRSVSDVLPLFVYRWGLLNLQYALATAVGVIQSFINLILLLGANFVIKRIDGEAGLW
ncbi:MAG: ABC transporter permease subunit [Oscillospiraceae bacterium]|jgi:putative aldouronate transport system permease protein|nr:ABC transporter permease subunit [Oscillospiraceae bacterium]